MQPAGKMVENSKEWYFEQNCQPLTLPISSVQMAKEKWMFGGIHYLWLAGGGIVEPGGGYPFSGWKFRGVLKFESRI